MAVGFAGPTADHNAVLDLYGQSNPFLTKCKHVNIH